jgi:hypothetical protein
MLAINERERKTEFGLEFVLPLPNHSRGRGDGNEINAPTQQHFAQSQTCFNCLAGADIVGKAQGLPQREKLIGDMVDASPEGAWKRSRSAAVAAFHRNARK